MFRLNKIFFGLALNLTFLMIIFVSISFVSAFTQVETGTEQNPAFSPQDGNVKIESLTGPAGPKGEQGDVGPAGSKGSKGDTGPKGDDYGAGCGWYGGKWISHGIDGGCAFGSGVWIDCVAGMPGMVKSTELVKDCGL